MISPKFAFYGTIIFVGISILSGFIYDYNITKAELETKKAELLLAKSHIDSQNAAIESLKIDVDKYANRKPEIVEKIITKYANDGAGSKQDQSCEGKLRDIGRYVDLFFERELDKMVNYIDERGKKR